MTDLEICLRLRALGYRPHTIGTVDGTAGEIISYPFPTPEGPTVLVRRTPGDPTSMVECIIPPEALDLI